MTFTIVDSSLTPGVQLNLLDNPGFEVWQRGTSFSSPAAATYLADRWQQQGNTTGASWTITQESSTVDTGNFSLKVNVTATGSSTSNYISQPFEVTNNVKGKTLTFAVRINTTLVNKVGIEINDGTQNVQSATHTGGGVWQTLSATITVSNSATQLVMHIGFVSSPNITTGIYYADSATMVYGPNSAPFYPLHPMIDLARCQRYYEISPTIGTIGCSPIPGFNNSNLFDLSTQFSVSKRANPTVTISNVTASVSQIATVNISSAPVADDANWTSTSVINTAPAGFDVRYQRNSATTSFSVIRWAYNWTASADL